MFHTEHKLHKFMWTLCSTFFSNTPSLPLNCPSSNLPPALGILEWGVSSWRGRAHPQSSPLLLWNGSMRMGMPKLAAPSSWHELSDQRTSCSRRSGRGMKEGISTCEISLPTYTSHGAVQGYRLNYIRASANHSGYTCQHLRSVCRYV